MKKESSLRNIVLINKKKMFTHLYQEEPLSRADLAKQLNLSFPTISANIKDMINAGLVFEEGMGNINSVGRKSTLLKIAREYAFVLCGSISLNESILALTDIKGDILMRKKIPTPKGSLNELIEEIKIFSMDAIKQNPAVGGKIKAISLGMHGLRFVSKSKNFLHKMNDLTDIQSELSQAFNCDVVVENDVNMAVLGEWWKSQYSEKDNIVFINISDGIGAGFMIDGQLYKGHHGSSGEIGNSVLDFAQMFQKYDDDGAFESLIIGQSARHELTALVQTLHDNAGSDPDLLLRIIHSNKVFIFLCMMLINITCLLDPDKIILGGVYGLEFARIANLFRMIIEEYAPTGSPAIIGSELGIDAVLYGAIHSGIERIKTRIYSDMGDM